MATRKRTSRRSGLVGRAVSAGRRALREAESRVPPDVRRQVERRMKDADKAARTAVKQLQLQVKRASTRADVNAVLKRIDGLTKQARQVAAVPVSRAASRSSSTRKRASTTTRRAAGATRRATTTARRAASGTKKAAASTTRRATSRAKKAASSTRKRATTAGSSTRSRTASRGTASRGTASRAARSSSARGSSATRRSTAPRKRSSSRRSRSGAGEMTAMPEIQITPMGSEMGGAVEMGEITES